MYIHIYKKYIQYIYIYIYTDKTYFWKCGATGKFKIVGPCPDWTCLGPQPQFGRTAIGLGSRFPKIGSAPRGSVKKQLGSYPPVAQFPLISLNQEYLGRLGSVEGSQKGIQHERFSVQGFFPIVHSASLDFVRSWLGNVPEKVSFGATYSTHRDTSASPQGRSRRISRSRKCRKGESAPSEEP